VQDDHDQTTAISPLISEELQGKKKHVSLIVMTGPTAGQTVKLDTKEHWKLGRATENDIVLQEASVSREHCQIHFLGRDEWQLEDLGSSNGTFVNSEKVESKVSLQNGDRIQMGSGSILKFVLQDELEMAFQKELYESATKDALTGLYSKRYFLEQLEVEFNFHQRTQKPLSLVIGDIDHFKVINDTYGHIAGDYVLKEVGRIFLNILRKGDVAGRYGGEEVLFLLRETPLPGAKTFAERIRLLIENHSFIFEGKKIPITLSLGAATFVQNNFKTTTELIQSADSFLYKAKNAGRNRTYCLIDS